MVKRKLTLTYAQISLQGHEPGDISTILSTFLSYSLVIQIASSKIKLSFSMVFVDFEQVPGRPISQICGPNSLSVAKWPAISSSPGY